MVEHYIDTVGVGSSILPAPTELDFRQMPEPATGGRALQNRKPPYRGRCGSLCSGCPHCGCPQGGLSCYAPAGYTPAGVRKTTTVQQTQSVWNAATTDKAEGLRVALLAQVGPSHHGNRLGSVANSVAGTFRRSIAI